MPGVLLWPPRPELVNELINELVNEFCARPKAETKPEFINHFTPHKHTTAVQAVGLGGFGGAIAPPQKVTQGGCGGSPPCPKATRGVAGGGSPQVGWVGRPEIINYYCPHKHTTAVQAVGLWGFGGAIAPQQNNV